MSEYSCDRCGEEVPNGHGYYPFGDTNDRVCRVCASLDKTDYQFANLNLGGNDE